MNTYLLSISLEFINHLQVRNLDIESFLSQMSDIDFDWDSMRINLSIE